ncbi:MAG: ATP-dependent sacrificial sulfur transferase LarE [Rhodospirillaceae bacterium]|nr:ATP-dependent sacrificial sulfur transferase LarE [Rhodospirillaceae bacterium]
MSDASTRLQAVLRDLGPVAVAVSGGVDSMTLAHVAHDLLGDAAMMVHAISPAVPSDATARVERHAERAGWALRKIDAGEQSDPRYRANPVDRCFYCKTNLYGSIAPLLARHADGAAIVSGTNLDDLGDYRPGLRAADEHGVRHPYVEAEIDKSRVRQLARELGLEDLAELPAAPCLASRIETGIEVTSERLTLIDAIEAVLREKAPLATIRARIRFDGLVLELDVIAMAAVDGAVRSGVSQLAREGGLVGEIAYEPYRKGSAFLREAVTR